jgi:hypothetical protein
MVQAAKGNDFILFAHGHGQDPLEGGGGSHYYLIE